MMINGLSVKGYGMNVILNPDKDKVSKIRAILAINEGYCPCKPEHTGEVDYLCPCKEFKEDRVCCCELYVEE